MKLLFLTLLYTAAFFLVFTSLASTATGKQGDSMEKAVFAGGCFWCMEKPFEKEPGVISVISGYTAGQTEMPTYENYLMGGHIEAVQVTYNPTKVSYERLLDIFWRQINPTDPGGQFVDRGHGYISAIFYGNNQQKKSAIASKNSLTARMIFSAPIVTEIVPLQTIYPAEEYHQDYYKKNPIRYSFYRNNSGRDQFLRKIWGNSDGTTKWSEKELRQRLTPLQFQVTQKNGTEPPFSNKLWDNKREGIYVDIVSGEPLFSSKDKFDSGTGWPSFSQPLVSDNIQEREDNSLFSRRTEVRSTKGDSHLGHLFDDGPKPSHLRYCINSAALRFVGVEELQQEGYGYLLPNFK